MHKLTPLILIILFNVCKAYAGWYECYNFTGTIDKYPITFSIQVREGYFGEKNKKDFNIIGVYKYDQHNEPISLEGKINFKTHKVLLYELSATRHTALFAFDFSKTECKGTWTNMLTGKQLPLYLNFATQLTDTAETDTYSNIEILQKNSLNRFYFIGVYSKQKGADQAQMDKLKIIRKADNVLIQTLSFAEVGTPTGNVYTVIYDNVPTAHKKTNLFQVSNYIGRTGGLLTIKYKPQIQKFVLNPVPELDGPG